MVGGKRIGAGRKPSANYRVRVSMSAETRTKLERLGKAMQLLARRDQSYLGEVLNRLMARVETPEDLLPEYLRLARARDPQSSR